jgi:hypothetical protein
MDFYEDPIGNPVDYPKIWELVGKGTVSAANWAKDTYESLGSKSIWTTIQGSSFNNIIGLPLGGRTDNLMGNSVRIICPWWGLIKRLKSGPDSEVGWSGLVTGIGGDTAMVFGKKTYFTYFSDSVIFEFSNNKIEANYQVPDGVNIDSFSTMGAKGLYYAPAITAVLGALALTTTILCLKHIWKFSSSDVVGNNASVMKWAMLLVPQIESQWLYLAKFLHTMGYSSIPMEIREETGVIKQAYYKSKREARLTGLQLDKIKGKIEAAKSTIERKKKQISNLEGFLAISFCNELVPIKIGQIQQEIGDLEWDLLAYESEERVATEKVLKISEQAIKDSTNLASLGPKA